LVRLRWGRDDGLGTRDSIVTAHVFHVEALSLENRRSTRNELVDARRVPPADTLACSIIGPITGLNRSQSDEFAQLGHGL
jgi:hypothetical protein